MARNEEKQWARLNRLHLEKEKQEYANAHPKRPRLRSLNTVAQIRTWLPDVKREIDFCLKQAQVTCYSEQKVAEYLDRVEKLKGSYKALCDKLRRLDPSFADVPWTEAGYKRTLSDPGQVPEAKISAGINQEGEVPFRRIPTPLLDSEPKPISPLKGDGPTFPEPPLQDQPLQFVDKEENVTPSKPDRESKPNVGSRRHHPLGLEYSSSSSDQDD